MSSASGLLIVDRRKWAAVTRTAAIGSAGGERLSAATIAQRYRGFEGEPWPEVEGVRLPELRRGLARVADLQAVRSYYRYAMVSHPCDLVCVQCRTGSAEDDRLQFLGFDYGYYESETNYYSALFHECIFGVLPELADFAGFVNESLLFPSIEVVDAFAAVRRRLLKDGADLEDDQTCERISIHGLPELEQRNS